MQRHGLVLLKSTSQNESVLASTFLHQLETGYAVFLYYWLHRDILELRNSE